ncbi:MAG: [LysW]-aminoadipate kinase [Candidatus Dormibacteraeota bacterium]|uniref:[LysW]-aminoadipate kinase n=1 Tax=Candidatus Amunia macphersoniae TaxID=3127014 RepID=A0A934NF16_9BACT|nr:[LysW]-aminoadipate kinase [Candidatus Dormibacteraeota bacterium]
MSGPPLVVKIGGSLEDPTTLLDDIAAHQGPLVIVHGAHRVLDELARRLGHPPRLVTSARGESSRYTDAAAMDHFLMAYCGLVNKRLVQQLLARDVRAIGLAAMDAGMVRGRRRTDLRIREDGRTLMLHGDHAGSIESVDTTVLTSLLEAGHTPVLCPPALGDDGSPINVDGDRLAAELAIAIGAERLIIFSDTAGFLADPDDAGSTLPRASLEDLGGLAGSARGRVRVKLAAVERALRAGIDAVALCDGRGARPLCRALDGEGTWFTAPAMEAEATSGAAPQAAAAAGTAVSV